MTIDDEMRGNGPVPSGCDENRAASFIQRTLESVDPAKHFGLGSSGPIFPRKSHRSASGNKALANSNDKFRANQGYFKSGAALAAMLLPLLTVVGGSKRYPSRVRMWYFCKSGPTSFTLIERQPWLGLGCG